MPRPLLTAVLLVFVAGELLQWLDPALGLAAVLADDDATAAGAYGRLPEDGLLQAAQPTALEHWRLGQGQVSDCLSAAAGLGSPASLPASAHRPVIGRKVEAALVHGRASHPTPEEKDNAFPPVNVAAISPAGASAPAGQGDEPMRQRIIFDTDIGTDIDDAYALALILASPELELVGVTIANNRTDQRAKLALKMLYETGLERIPVAVGRITETGGSVNQYPWAEDFAATQPIAQPAAEFLVDQVNQHPGEITILAVGPFTNIGDALALDPQFLHKARSFCIMGGCVGWPEGATPEIIPEYNIVTDIPASQAMFQAGVPLMMVPLDATMQVQLQADFSAKLEARGTPLTDALTALLALWPHRTPTLHDPLAVGMLLDPALCGVAEMHIEVDQEGITRASAGEPNCRVAVTPRVGAFLHLFMERLLAQDLNRE